MTFVSLAVVARMCPLRDVGDAGITLKCVSAKRSVWGNELGTDVAEWGFYGVSPALGPCCTFC